MTKYTDGTRTWSNRYYATKEAPCAFFDLEILALLTNVPDESALHPLTDEQWKAHVDREVYSPLCLCNGELVDHCGLPDDVTLAQRAEGRLRAERIHVQSQFIVFGDDIPRAWQTYLKALRDIAQGIDTVATSLPLPPDHKDSEQ